MGAHGPVSLNCRGYRPASASPSSSFGLGVAAPRVARRAKRGGARRDRTADLLHAMQALSQLSYGPEKAARLNRRTGQNPEHSSGLISSLLVAGNVADDVGHVFVAFFLIGDEGGIV